MRNNITIKDYISSQRMVVPEYDIFQLLKWPSQKRELGQTSGI